MCVWCETYFQHRNRLTVTIAQEDNFAHGVDKMAKFHPNPKDKHFTIGNTNLIHFRGPMATASDRSLQSGFINSEGITNDVSNLMMYRLSYSSSDFP